MTADILRWALYPTPISAWDARVATLSMERTSAHGGALLFFLYGTPKVLLLTAVVFLQGIVGAHDLQ